MLGPEQKKMGEEKEKRVNCNIDVQQLIFHLIDFGHTDMILFGK